MKDMDKMMEERDILLLTFIFNFGSKQNKEAWDDKCTYYLNTACSHRDLSV